MTTKQCPDCGSDALVLLHSTDTKLCADCKSEFHWPLDEGQKAVLTSHRDTRKPAHDPA